MSMKITRSMEDINQPISNNRLYPPLIQSLLLKYLSSPYIRSYSPTMLGK